MNFNMSKEEIGLFQKTIIDWGKENYHDFPWRSCQIPIHQLLSEILLQRTKAEQVVPIFQKLLGDYPDLESLSRLHESEISTIIHPLGLHWRASLIHKLIQKIKFEYCNKIPEDEKLLKKLPGVGSYVSAAYLSLHRNRRASIIDSNVVRVYGRFFGFPFDAETRRKGWLIALASKLTPEIEFRVYNYAILDLARLICKKKPLCNLCPNNVHCCFE